MNTKLIISALVAIFIIGGFWYTTKSNKMATTQPPSPQSTDMKDASKTTMKNTEPTQITEKDTSIIRSIKDAMGLGTKMQCTYTDTSGSGISTTMFIEGKKMKTKTQVNNETMYGIFDGETQYSWTTGTKKQGFKMDKACMDSMKSMAEKLPKTNTPTPSAPADIDAIDALKNVNCSPAESEDFTIPTEITFVDQCAMMKDSMKMMEQLKNKMPEGVKLPAGIPAGN